MINESKSPRPWLIALPTIALVVLGIIWSGFWYYASSRAQDAMTAWRDREANAGRIYGCGDASFGGYPFRIEVACNDPSLEDRATQLAIRAHNLAAVAQVWDPTLVIGEIVGPMTVAPLGGAPTAQVDWALAQASLRGMPGAPEQLAVVLDKPRLASAAANGSNPLAKADHLEFHTRFAADSTPAHRVLDLALDLTHFTAPAAGTLPAPLDALLGATTDGAIVAVLRGAPDLTLKPVAQQLRAIEAAGGRLEIVNARLRQGDVTVRATGALALTPRGTLTGDLTLTVVNFAKLIPLLGIDRVVAQAVPADKLERYAPTLDRAVPGLGNVLRGGGTKAQDSNAGANLAALGAAIVGGKETEFEGQRAVSVMLHFDDGAISLGPVKLGRVAPLF